MRNKLILILLLSGICFYAQQSFAEDMSKYSDERLRQRIREGEEREREAKREMEPLYKEKVKADGELSRAERGEYNADDVLSGGFQGVIDRANYGDTKRVEEARNKSEQAQQEYDDSKRKWDYGVYMQGSAQMELERREKARQKSR
jgi:hypothetical protein